MKRFKKWFSGALCLALLLGLLPPRRRLRRAKRVRPRPKAARPCQRGAACWPQGVIS